MFFVISGIAVGVNLIPLIVSRYVLDLEVPHVTFLVQEIADFASGSIGFADPRARMSFGYVMSRQGIGLGINERGQSLVDAAYRALGYRRPETGGIWYAPSA